MPFVERYVCINHKNLHRPFGTRTNQFYVNETEAVLMHAAMVIIFSHHQSPAVCLTAFIFCNGSNCVTKLLRLNIQMCVLPVILVFEHQTPNCCDLMLGSVRGRGHVYEPCCVRHGCVYFVVFSVIFTANSKQWQTKLWIWITNDRAIKKRLKILDSVNPPRWVDKCLIQVLNMCFRYIVRAF